MAGVGITTPALALATDRRRPDPLEVLPPAARERLQKLRLRVKDLHALVPAFDERHELATRKLAATQRLSRLLSHPHNGGFGLSHGDPRCVTAEAEVANLTEAHDAITQRYEQRGAVHREAGQVLGSVQGFLREWIDRRGNTVLEDVEAPALPKGDLLAALARSRQAGDELVASLKALASRPYPSEHAKRRMIEMVEALGNRVGGSLANSVSNLLRADHDIAWPQSVIQVEIHNAPDKPIIGFCNVPDIALLAWTPDTRAALIDALSAEIDRQSDDAQALGVDERSRREGELRAQILEQNRVESAIVWACQERNLPAEHRLSCAPLAILGCEEIVHVRAEPVGSSYEHAYDVLGRR